MGAVGTRFAASAVLSIAACGRVGFATAPPDGTAPTPDTAIDGPEANVVWVQSFVRAYANGGTTTLLGTGQASTSGDAVAFLIACGGVPNPPTAFEVTAPGWTFTQSASFGSPTIWGVVLSGIAPDTQAVNITATWSPACINGITMIGDDFTGNDPAGGTTTFDGHVETSGTGTCIGTGHGVGRRRAVVWAACASSDPITGIGSGFTQGTTDGAGDFTEFKLTSDPAGTPETTTFVNSTADNYVLSAVTIRPR